ncbi:type II toxin-antitoxin system RelE/ParE family toxin [Candidatus Peregrinibacteria bacterium]|nr:type II toxin-antitoxin system RelE/ParE family toxin [Candidatus Peregrinibacteria bacterium]
MFALEIRPKAKKQIARLCQHDRKLEEKLRKALGEIQDNPFKAGQALKGFTDYMRCKVDYRHRLVYRVIGNVIFVMEFATRENVDYD